MTTKALDEIRRIRWENVAERIESVYRGLVPE